MEKETILEALKNRRSVRSFNDKDIEKDDLNKIIEVAQNAPSAMNRQDYQITVVQNEDLKKEIIETLRESLKDEKYNGFYSSKIYVLISSPNDNPNGNLDSACVALNLMNAASVLDIGTVWVNQFKNRSDEENVRALLNKLEIPDNHKIDVSIALGYSDSQIHKERVIKSKVVYK